MVTDGSTIDGYAGRSRDAYLQRLRTKGYIEQRGETVLLTDAGADALGSFEPLPTGSDLQAYWLDRLPEGERKCLEILVNAAGNWIDRARISEETGYKRSSRDAYLQRLKARKLIDVYSGNVKAATLLFD